MLKFNNFYLANEGTSKLNTHLEHLEDELLNFGNAGVDRAVNFITGLMSALEGHSDKAYNVTTKWDGAPAIVCGTDPMDGKFFVGTKSAGNKNKPVRIKMINVDDGSGDEKFAGMPYHKRPFAGKKMKDIDFWYNDKPELKKKIEYSWKYLRHLNIKDFMLQGDLMWTPGTLTQVNIPDAMNNPREYIKFRANTITYAIPADSKLAAKMLKAKIGIVFHTLYFGTDWDDIQTDYNFDKEIFQLEDQGDLDAAGILYKGVWFDDAKIKDISGQVNLTQRELQDLSGKVNQVISLHRRAGDVYKFMSTGACKDLAAELKVNINAVLRQKQAFTQDPVMFAEEFLTWYLNRGETTIVKRKTEAGQTKRRNELQTCVDFVRQHWDDLQKFYSMYLLIIEVKLALMDKLKRLRTLTDTFKETGDGTFEVTEPEGYVAVDHHGSAVKIVDRLEFAVANFQPKNFG